MERRSRPARRLLVTAACAAIALVGTSCGARGPLGAAPAATVNGHEVSSDELIDAVEGQRRLIELLGEGAKTKRAEGEAQGLEGPTAEQLAANLQEQLAQFDGAGAETLAADNVAAVLGLLINDQISQKALEVAGAEVADADRKVLVQEVEQQLAGEGVEAADVPPAILDRLVEQRAIRMAIEATAPEEVTSIPVTSTEDYEQQLRAIYDAQPDQYVGLCLNLLVAPDEQSAVDARSRIEAGETLLALAEELSPEEIESASDGGGGCGTRSELIGLLGEDGATAQAGDLVGPTMVEDGVFLLGEVAEVIPRPFEEARAEIEEANPNTQGEEAALAALNAYVDEVFIEATELSEVTVDPTYGTWSPDSATVIPPVDPGASRLAPIEGRAPVPAGAEDSTAGP